MPIHKYDLTTIYNKGVSSVHHISDSYKYSLAQANY